ncbi:MAG: hypothetical protein ACP5I4_10895 [Oceanipulchritudo sp.]
MEGFLTLLALLIVGHVLITPLVLIGIARSHRRRLKELEADYRDLREQMALREPVATREPVTRPLEKPVQERVEPSKPHAAEPPKPEGEPVLPPPEVAERGPVPRGSDLALRTARLKEALRRMGLWPPGTAAEQNRETVLMQWWLPRVGGLLALLSALFFGVYINQSTSALFKCLELVAVSLVVSGTGRFLERRYPAFGGVLVVTGLIMLYLTSVAAYVLPATRVIGDPLAGSLVQAFVLAGICVVGLLRRSTALVTLALCFGYVLGVFMAWEGLREGALIAAGLLFAAGAAMERVPQLRHLAWIYVPGTFLVALAFPVMSLFRVVEIPLHGSLQVYLNFALAALAGLYLKDAVRGAGANRILLSLGSSLCLLAMAWGFRTFHPEVLEWALLVLGLNALGWSLLSWVLRGCGYAAQLLFIKASFLVAVWAVLYFAGDLRWMVLALQAVVVAFAARRARRFAMEAVVWAVAIASYLLFMQGSGGVSHGFVWWMKVLYPGVLVAAFAVSLPVYDVTKFSLQKPSRKWAYWMVPLVACGTWYGFFSTLQQREFSLAFPFVMITYAMAVLSLVPLFSRWLLLLTASMAFVAGSVLYWTQPFSMPLLALIVLAGAAGLHYVLRIRERYAEVAENVLYLLMLVSFVLWLLQLLDNSPAQGALVLLLCIGVLFSGMAPRLRHPGAWSFLPLLVFIVAEEGWVYTGPWMPVTLAVGLAWLCVPLVYRDAQTALGWSACRGLWSLVWAVLLWIHAVQFGDPEAPWISGQILYAVVSILLLLGAWRWGAPGFSVGALLFLAVPALRHGTRLLGEAGPHVPWGSEVLVSAAFLYAFALASLFLRPRAFGGVRAEQRRFMELAWSVLGALLLFFTSAITFHYEPLGMLSWYTPVLALTAFVMILLGLFRLDVAWRWLGMMALAVPLVRLFVVDVKDALHRIIAFAAAAVLITLLGYLYHRLSERLKRD